MRYAHLQCRPTQTLLHMYPRCRRATWDSVPTSPLLHQVLLVCQKVLKASTVNSNLAILIGTYDGSFNYRTLHLSQAFFDPTQRHPRRNMPRLHFWNITVISHTQNPIHPCDDARTSYADHVLTRLVGTGRNISVKISRFLHAVLFHSSSVSSANGSATMASSARSVSSSCGSGANFIAHVTWLWSLTSCGGNEAQMLYSMPIRTSVTANSSQTYP